MRRAPARCAAKLFSVFSVFSLCSVLLVACGDGTAPDVVPAFVVPSSAAPLTLQSGGTVALTAVVQNKSLSPLAGAPVTWSSSDPAVASVTAGGVVSAVRVGQATVVAASGAVRSAGIVITVLPGAASALAIVAQPAGAAAGTPLVSQPRVEIRDAAGNVVTSSTQPVTATVASGGGALVGPATVAAVNGVASFAGLALTGAVGDRTLGFSADALTAATSAPFTLTFGAASQLVLRTQPSGAASGAPLTAQPVIEVQDAWGNLVASSALPITATIVNGGTLSGAAAVASGGVAAFSALTVTGLVGSRSLVFGATGVTGATSAPFLLVPGAPARYLISAAPAAPVAGTNTTVAAQLADASGNAISGSAAAGRVVTWSKTGAGGVFAAPSSATDANGFATVLFTTAPAVTAYTITAFDVASLSGTSAAFTSVPGPAARYGVTVSAVNPVVGQVVTITARLTDANGNAIATAGRAVTWTATTSGGTFTPGVSAVDASGTASTAFTVGPAAGAVYIVTATDASGIAGSAPAITTSTAIPTTVVNAGPPVVVIDSGATLASPFQVFDQSGRLLSGVVLSYPRQGAVTTTAAGVISAAHPGQIMLVAAAPLNVAARDSVLVLVASRGGPLLRTDLSQFRLKADTTFTVTIVADMRSTGLRLGSLGLAITWDTALLAYVSDAEGASGTGASVNRSGVANGTLNLALASSAGFDGAIQLRTITFRATSVAGRTGALSLLVTDCTAASSFADLLSATVAARFPLVTR
jgi:hypothetical protein